MSLIKAEAKEVHEVEDMAFLDEEFHKTLSRTRLIINFIPIIRNDAGEQCHKLTISVKEITYVWRRFLLGGCLV